MQIRPVSRSDLAAVIALNDGAIPHVTRLDEGLADQFFHEADVFVVAEQDGALLGFLVGLRPGLAYDSLNYRWFAERYARFLYVDRLVVEPEQRGAGVGRKLYQHVIAEAGDVPITCEVNVRPPNPRSLAFHERLGFAEVGRLRTERGAKEVSLLRLSSTSEGTI